LWPEYIIFPHFHTFANTPNISSPTIFNQACRKVNWQRFKHGELIHCACGLYSNVNTGCANLEVCDPQSKQYLTTHTLEDVHPADIFALAPTARQLISASGSSSILIHELPGTSPSATASPENHIPKLIQKIEKAHAAGIHHLAAAAEGNTFVSAGFGGEVLIWKQAEGESGGSGEWELAGRIKESLPGARKAKAVAGSDGGETGVKTSGVGELWSLAMTANGRYLAASSYDGKLRVWDMLTGEDREEKQGKNTIKIREPEVVREYDTRGSFGMCVAIVRFS
jgi:superkiller protein 8